MDHAVVVRQKMTERYLLDELEPEAREQFEEHYFDCPACAMDVRAGATFIEQSKVVLAERPIDNTALQPVPVPVRPGRFGWLRPAFVLPVMALLVGIIGYQNLVTYPQLTKKSSRPSVLPYAPVNVGTYGSDAPVVKAHAGEDFLIFVRIPPEGDYSSYAADLYDAAGTLEWSVTIPAESGRDQWPVQVPGANRAAGTYTVAVRGIGAGGDSKELGRARFELQIQK
jgi:Putative zinc-finger